MSARTKTPVPKCSGATHYRIEVQGKLNAAWKERLGGMEVSVDQDAGNDSLTTLTGVLRDQAELSGVLDSLFSLHLPILRVERVQDERQKNTINSE